MSTHYDVPRPGDTEADLTDDELVKLLNLVADNLEIAQETLSMVTVGANPTTEATKRNAMHAAVAQAHAATAQGFAVYILLCSAGMERRRSGD
jgi:hypothetical protein